jgi:Uri superfamily endonuclease
MESKPGTYALILRSDSSACAQIGCWGRLNVRPGYYNYVGSAFGPGGVFARVSRHCRDSKSRYWHIDYLREFATLASVWYSYAPVHLEHRWAQVLAGLDGIEAVKGFGCSDCNCDTHLIFAAREPRVATFESRFVVRLRRARAVATTREHRRPQPRPGWLRRTVRWLSVDLHIVRLPVGG